MSIKNEILRQLLSSILGVILGAICSALDLSFPEMFLPTMYAVLGIFYSITMSLTISFDYRAVTNRNIRKNIRTALFRIKGANTSNFLFTTCVLIFCSALSSKFKNYILCFFFEYWPLAAVMVSLYLSIHTFNLLFKLKNELEDEIAKEFDDK